MAGSTQTDQVSGNGPYSASYALPTTGTVAGTYLWHAVYTSGDGNNLTASDNGANETTVVSPAQPTLTTQASGDITLGTGGQSITDTADLEGAYNPTGSITLTISDTATLSGAYNPTGSITFTLTLDGNSVAGSTQTDQVSGNGPYSASYALPTTGTVAGTYLWHAVYTSGDGNNLTASDNGANETTVVSPAQPTLTTQASGDITLGTGGQSITDTADLEGAYNPTGSITLTISDTATLSGAYNPTGSITFTLTLDGNSVAGSTQTDQVSGNGPYSASYALPTTGTVAGTYLWHAVYTSGDGNNLTASDNGANETTVVSPAQPTLTTQASGDITLGTGGQSITDTADLEGAYNPTGSITLTISDTATLSGAYNPTGSITFTLTLDGNSVAGSTQTDQVSGNGPYSASYALPTTGTVAGTYLCHAVYTSGDGNNLTASDNGANETTVVSPAQPTLTTQASGDVALGTIASPATATLGTTAPTITDTIVMSGAYFPTGNVDVTLKLGSTTVKTDSFAAANATVTESYTLPTTGTVTGTYTWSVSYVGDGNNKSAVDQGGEAEQTKVSPASPAIVTTANPTGTFYAGTTAPTLSDSAVVSGAYHATGSIVFTLTGPGGFSYTQTVTVNGNGTYSASTSSETATGLYIWVVTYNGDGNNKTANDQGGPTEQVTIKDQVVSGQSATMGFWSNRNGQASSRPTVRLLATGLAASRPVASSVPSPTTTCSAI